VEPTKNLKQLIKGYNVAVATAGRLLKLAKLCHIDFTQLRFLVINKGDLLLKEDQNIADLRDVLTMMAPNVKIYITTTITTALICSMVQVQWRILVRIWRVTLN